MLSSRVALIINAIVLSLVLGGCSSNVIGSNHDELTPDNIGRITLANSTSSSDSDSNSQQESDEIYDSIKETYHELSFGTIALIEEGDKYFIIPNFHVAAHDTQWIKDITNIDLPVFDFFEDVPSTYSMDAFGYSIDTDGIEAGNKYIIISPEKHLNTIIYLYHDLFSIQVMKLRDETPSCDHNHGNDVHKLIETEGGHVSIYLQLLTDEELSAEVNMQIQTVENELVEFISLIEVTTDSVSYQLVE